MSRLLRTTPRAPLTLESDDDLGVNESSHMVRTVCALIICLKKSFVQPFAYFGYEGKRAYIQHTKFELVKVSDSVEIH